MKPWRLYCRECQWRGEEGAAMPPTCPECRAALRLEVPPYEKHTIGFHGGACIDESPGMSEAIEGPYDPEMGTGAPTSFADSLGVGRWVRVEPTPMHEGWLWLVLGPDDQAAVHIPETAIRRQVGEVLALYVPRSLAEAMWEVLRLTVIDVVTSVDVPKESDAWRMQRVARSVGDRAMAVDALRRAGYPDWRRVARALA